MITSKTRPALRPAATSFLLTCAASLALGLEAGHAQSIPVPNFSFESQTAPNSVPYVNTNVDSWKKAEEPGYYGPAIGTPFGIPWQGTAGVFLDVNPYANHVGSQAGYILGFPQVELYQDYSSSPAHDFDATFEIGKIYDLNIGIFGKSTLAPGSTLQISLYYREGVNNDGARVNVASATATYSALNFPTGAPLNLVDYNVHVDEVTLSNDWAGKKIGIQLLSTSPIELATGGNWDFDNVRLTATPEPGTLGLLGLAVGGFLLRRRRQS